MASDVDVEPCKREMPKLAVVIEEDAEHGEKYEENIARGNMKKKVLRMKYEGRWKRER